jgi:hypothetical protein
MALGLDEIEEVIEAAIAAEAWFTHQECVAPDSLDYRAFQIADKLRSALKHIEDVSPDTTKRMGEAAWNAGLLFQRF